MSPILVRPVREQLEHDRVIRLLQAKYKRKFDVAINPGNVQAAPVGVAPSQWYPDLVLNSAERGHKLVGVVEVETAESVESHVTITRLMLFGPLGLFAPKTTRTAYMTIESLDGDWIFAVDGLDAASLWAEVLPVSTRRPGVFRFGRPAAS